MSVARAIVRTGAFVLFAGALAAGWGWYAKTQAPCATPILYRTGAFDPRFGISHEAFARSLAQAAAVWNTAAGKTVLKEDARGSLSVNLLYDARQAATQKNQVLQGSIEEGKAAAGSVQAKYETLTAAYDADKRAYETGLAAYETNLGAYNQSVAYWNAAGGAPRSEYEKLNAEKEALAEQEANLETQRAALNAKADDVNALIDQYNLLASHVNEVVATANQNAGREFEEGEYVADASGTRINVYEFQSAEKLARVLAHEFGHALGLPHNADPASIMYSLNQGTNIAPSAEDIAALKTACGEKN